VCRNKGAAGVDGREVTYFGDYLKAHWPRHRQELLEGTYQPQPVRQVEIPKPGGGKRQLGIPTVLDRFIQQALHQVLSPVSEPGFSKSGYGFRPGRNAAQAVLKAREYVEVGHHWIVDIDLEAFFDRVNHDMLMARVARQVKDKRGLKLIRGYLESGVCEEGLVTARRQGTPQGGPLSPLLSNILLTNGTGNWISAGTGSVATPMTAPSTSRARRREHGCWSPSRSILRRPSNCGLTGRRAGWDALRSGSSLAIRCIAVSRRST